MTPKQLRDRIESAMRERAPAEVRALERSGRLEQLLSSRVESALEAISEMEEGAVFRSLSGDGEYLAKVQALTEARRRAESTAIQDAAVL